MAKEKPRQVDWPACQLMLVIEPGPGARERLRAALEVTQTAAVLIRPKAGQQLGGGEVKPLVDVAQEHGAAAILFEDTQLVKTLRADGVHLPVGLDVRQHLEAARAVLADGSSVGVDAGVSRHQAMEAGEAGADYVAFGAGDGSDAALMQRDELIAWWSDIFEVPCVALGLTDAPEVEAIGRLGADFAALSLPSNISAEDVAKLAGDCDARLSAAAIPAGETR